MDIKISAVLNTINEEKNIDRALKSVKWADEIIIVDDGSSDKTLEIAKKYTKRIYKHKSAGYVEPARNFAISKAIGEWILLLDADEQIPTSLADKLKEIAQKMRGIGYVEIPRKNIIFGRWMKASMWWPDFHPRFFRKGKVVWKDEIHSKPQLLGEGIKLEAEGDLAIIHYHYDSLTQFIGRMNRYTTIQAEELIKAGHNFDWKDLINKPLGEFLGRYFANRGFEDGLHGLSLSLLQAFSFLVMYLKLWEMEKFADQEVSLTDLKEVSKKANLEINYWFKYGNLSKNPFKRFFQKAKNRVT